MTQQVKGKSIRLFLVDGTPQGILTAEIMNWTGHVLSAPRTKLTEMVKRPEMERTGIYVLIGSDPDGSERPLGYIGESDVVGSRLVQHNKDESKDFWEKACVVTSKDQNLTKAHARYLESRLIAIAHGAGRARLFNGTAPDYGYLPEADLADMEYFISQIRLILPVLGLDFLREAPRINVRGTANAGDQNADPTFLLTSRKHNLTAEATEIEGEFVVRAGSQAKPEWIGAEGHVHRKLHQELFQDGSLATDWGGERAVFQTDVAFNSPSAAGAVILGRGCNGRKEWKVKGSSLTYAEWQDERLMDASLEVVSG